MKAIGISGVVTAMVLAGCSTTSDTRPEGTGLLTYEELPEEIRALVDPNPNQRLIQRLPEDGCYWYQWRGPVETTYLPLRTRDGRMICVQTAEEAAAAAAAG